MLKLNITERTSITINDSYEGETLEDKICRIVNNNEPISDGAPIIYTERKEGVKEEFNIRTDRWDIAIDAMDYVSRSNTAKRMERIKGDNVGEAESTQATA